MCFISVFVRYQQIVQYHIRQQDHKAVLASCRRFGHQDPSLWVQALWSCAKDPNMPSSLLSEILSVIGKINSVLHCVISSVLYGGETHSFTLREEHRLTFI